MDIEGLKVYVNDRVLPHKSAVSAFDWGLHYGYGLFETLRAYAGVPAFLEEHLKRLGDSARRLNIPLPHLEDTGRKIARLLALNGLEGCQARIKLILTRGTSADLNSPPESPTLIITTTPLDSRAIERLQQRGIVCITLRGWGSFGRDKTLSHIKNLLGRERARSAGAQEAIVTTVRGTVLEGTGSNIFMVKDGRLFTPSLRAGAILPGVTRGVVLELAKRAGIPTVERRLERKELEGCDGLFITNSVVEIVPVRLLDGQSVGNASGLKIIRFLQQEFRKLTPQGG